jgi:F0F1-type ATP synthase assembly protein I
MNEDGRSDRPRTGPGDAWTILGYLLSGLLVWGGAGFLVDKWLGTRLFVLIGLLVGMGTSIYIVYIRYGRP